MAEYHPHHDQLEVSGFGYSARFSGVQMVFLIGFLAIIGVLIWVIIDYMHSTHAAIAAQTQAIITAQAQQAQATQAAIAAQMDLSRASQAEQMNSLREQQLVTYRELRIQTALMSIPEGQRGQIIDTDKLRENLKHHLEATPYLSPPIMKGVIAPLRPLQMNPEDDVP
jgi:hypothetical protein